MTSAESEQIERARKALAFAQRLERLEGRVGQISGRLKALEAAVGMSPRSQADDQPEVDPFA